VIVLSGILQGRRLRLSAVLPSLFPSATRHLAALVAILAIIGMLYAALLALVQTDIKRIVAYASISHVNLIALGIFALNPVALNGSVLQIVNHGIIIAGLFLAIGYITSRAGSRSLTDLGGMGVKARSHVAVFVFVLAGLDLPGLSSFSGEFLILVGTFKANAWFASVAALTVILAAWYMIRLFQDTMNGPIVTAPAMIAEAVEDSSKSAYQYPIMRTLLTGDLHPREYLLFVPLLFLIFYIGLQPDGLTARINPTVNPTSYVVHSSAVNPTSYGARGAGLEGAMMAAVVQPLQVQIGAGDWGAVLPQIILAAGALLLLVLDVMPLPVALARRASRIDLLTGQLWPSRLRPVSVPSTSGATDR
jgi:NADH:ubiquinone oxidoreductase subunit 4 (subunit M)